MSVYHIYPLDDIKDHILEGTECPCSPTVLVEGDTLLVVHNAYDMREIEEEGGIAEVVKKYFDTEEKHE